MDTIKYKLHQLFEFKLEDNILDSLEFDKYNKRLGIYAVSQSINWGIINNKFLLSKELVTILIKKGFCFNNHKIGLFLPFWNP